MATVTLIMSLEATTVNNPSDSRSDSGVTSGVTVEQQQERWQSNMEPRTQLRSLNARIQGYDNPTINSSIVRYDSNCSHKPRGTSKPIFSSPKGYFPSITSIRNYRIVTHNFTNDDLTNGKTLVISC